MVFGGGGLFLLFVLLRLFWVSLVLLWCFIWFSLWLVMF